MNYPQGGQQPPYGYPQQYGYQPPPQAGYPLPPPGYPQPGYPMPPRKRRTGLWVGLAVTLVLVLAGVGVTGFVAPGFFLNKYVPLGAPGNLDARTLMTQLVDKLNTRDGPGARSYACQNANENVFTDFSQTLVAPDLSNFAITKVKSGDDTVYGYFSVTIAGGGQDPYNPPEGSVGMKRGPDGGYCVWAFSLRR